MSSEAPPLGKDLASSDKKTRDKAIQSLTAFFSDPTRGSLPPLELAKLWKGIFYCFWMSDKPLIQQALASDLAEILLKIPTPLSSLEFLSGFWEATVREWNGIDRLRMDKYLMFVRRFVNVAFRLLHQNKWDPAMCDQYNEILTRKGGPLCPDDIRVPAGLTYHLADIYLEELDKASVEGAPTPLNTILKPFIMLASRTPTKTIHERIKSALIEPVLQQLQPLSDNIEDPPRKRQKVETVEYTNLATNSCTSDGATDKKSVRTAFTTLIFDIASDEGTKDANRKRLYAIWKANTDEVEDE